MTINIAVAVAEGLVMAADSMTAVNLPNGSVLKNYPTGEKLTELADLPIAAMVWGRGAIENRSIISLIREFEFDSLRSGKKTAPSKVPDVAGALADFIAKKYDVANWGTQPQPQPGQPPQPWPPSLGVVVGGYSPGEFFPQVYEILFPGKQVNCKHPLKDKPPGSPSVTWWGAAMPLNRLVLGFDLNELTQAYEQVKNPAYQARLKAAGQPIPTVPSAPPNTCLPPLASLVGMKVVLDYMPLQEAIEFAEYLGEVTIGFSRFTWGVQIVGGRLDILAIQPEGLSWYKRKRFAAKMAEARSRARA